MNLRNTLSCMMLAAVAGSVAAAPVYINEIVTNPKGNDEEWEYIELYGCPGESLTGYAVLVVVDDPDDTSNPAEIDEAFHFPTSGTKYSLDEDGYFVIWNTGYSQSGGAGSAQNHANNSEIYDFLPDTVTNNGADINTSTDRHEASFIELQTAADQAGKLSNDGSITVVLLNNISDYTIIEKDDTPPLTMGEPDYPGDVIDEIAWSDNGGSEYTEEECNEFDHTPGFNPGYAIRVDNASCLIDDTSCDFDGEEYRSAYTNWYMGEIGSNPSGFSDYFLGDNAEGGFGAAAYGGTPCFDPVEDESNVEVTPGYANDSFPGGRGQISASCRVAGDANNDGQVDIRDIEYLLNHDGDYFELIEVLEGMGR